MKKRFIYIITLFILISLFSVCFLYNKKNNSNIKILELNNLEDTLKNYNIALPSKKDIHFYILDNTNVLILDNRNYNNNLYIHSNVIPKMIHGTLIVNIKDKVAVSESDISGMYGVIIQCNSEINEVIIHKSNE